MQHIPFKLFINEWIHPSGLNLLSPLHSPWIVRLNQAPEKLVKLLERSLDKDLLQKGRYKRFLRYVSDQDPRIEQLALSIEASSAQTYPALELSFDLICFELGPQQWMGSVPMLQVEAAGQDLEELRQNAIENIRLEFIRKNRKDHLTKILETQWYDSYVLHQKDIEAPFYTLAELEELNKEEEKGLLAKIGTPLTCEEQELFGLRKEKDQLIGFFRENSASSVIIIGHSGTGKTVLIRELARRLPRLRKSTPRKIWEFSAARLISRLSAMGSWEEGMSIICKELQQKGDILYIPRLTELFEVGQYVGNSLSVAGFLQPYLRREEIVVIGECTFEEANHIESRSPGYLSLFSTIKISEQSPQKNKKIIQQKVQYLAGKHEFSISDEAIREAYRLMVWFRPYSGLPGKAILFLDSLFSNPEPHTSNDIGIGEIYERFCKETGLPRFMIDPKLPLDEKQVRTYFQDRIFGQNEAIHTIVDLLLSIKAALIRRGKPLASLLFVGPTGVGKTEMAKVLANYLFGSRDRMLRFDMSEHSDIPGVLRLTGDASSGEGLLTSAIRQNPFSVVLFDELEKAHPNFFDLLLQILGEGRLTDARGRVADFSSTIIIMTSNIGARSYQTGSIGFVPMEVDVEAVHAHFSSEVQDYFRPELFNRLDRLIPFAPLSRPMIRHILNREMQHVLDRNGIKGRKIKLMVDDDILDQLGRVGYDPNYGARYLQRAIQEQFTISLAKSLNAYAVNKPLEVMAVQEEEKISFLISPFQDASEDYAMMGDQKRMTKVEFSDQVSESRRTIFAIEDGSIYTAFVSDLHKSERLLATLKRKNKEPLFWKNTRRATEYQESKKLRDRFTGLQSTIREMEIDCLLAMSGIDNWKTEGLEHWYKWRKDFLQIKLEVLQKQRPDYNICTIGIYGNPNQLYSIASIYEYIAKKQDFDMVKKSVWKHPDQETPLKEDFKPRETPLNCVLRGLELEFRGQLPYLWFHREAGCHSWLAGDSEEKYMIHIAALKLESEKETTYQTPEDFYRKSHSNKLKPRRVYQYGTGLKDTQYSITAKYPYPKVMLNILQTLLQRHLDSILIH